MRTYKNKKKKSCRGLTQGTYKNKKKKSWGGTHAGGPIKTRKRKAGGGLTLGDHNELIRRKAAYKKLISGNSFVVISSSAAKVTSNTRTHKEHLFAGETIVTRNR